MCLEDSLTGALQVFCGGSIYDETTIITAAHCCDGCDWTENPKVIAGDLDTSLDSGYEQVRGISNIMTHPAWLGADISFANDLCLLTLDSPLELNDQVKSIALDEAEPVPDTNCIVSGWGTLSVRNLGLHSFIYFITL